MFSLDSDDDLEVYQYLYADYLNYDYNADISLPEDTIIPTILAEIKAWSESKPDGKDRADFQDYFYLLAKLKKFIKSFQRLSADQNKLLVDFYLNEMTRIEKEINQYDLDHDPMMFGFFVNRDKMGSQVGNFLLSTLHVLDEKTQENLFRTLLEGLRKSERPLPKWVYSHGVLRLVETFDAERVAVCCEFFVKSIEDGTADSSSYESLVHILLSFCSADYRLGFFKYIVSRLGIDGFVRYKQKNWAYLFLQIYNKLDCIEELKVVFNEVIRPMLTSENLFIRQSLAEMLPEMSVFPDECLDLLVTLSQDREYEVRRFVDITQGGERDKEFRSTSQVSNKDSVRLNFSRDDERLKQELLAFERSLLPQNLVERCISALNHSNPHIAKFAWNRLHRQYLVLPSSNKQKLSWLNIAFSAFRKANFYCEELSFVDYLRQNFGSVKQLALPLINQILSLLQNENQLIDSRYWLNFLHNILLSHCDEALFKKVIGVFEHIIMTGSYGIVTRRDVISHLTSMSDLSYDYLLFITPVFARVINEASDKFRCWALTVLSEHIGYIDSIETLKPKFFVMVTRINFNHITGDTEAHLYNMLEQLLAFLVGIIAKYGDCPISHWAVDALCALIKNGDSAFAAWHVDALLNDYGIERLVILADLKILIEKNKCKKEKCHIANAFDKMDNLIGQDRFDEACQIITSFENNDVFLSRLEYFKAEIYYRQGRYSEAIEQYEAFLCDQPYYLKAKVRIFECYQQMSAFEEAERMGTKIHSVSPQLSLPHVVITQEQSPDGAFKPLVRTVALASLAIEDFIQSSLRLIADDALDHETAKQTIVKNFDVLKGSFFEYFGQEHVEDFFASRPNINWNDLMNYRHQLSSFMRDLLMGMIHKVLPSRAVRTYDIHALSVNRMCNLKEHIHASSIGEFTPSEPVSFLQSRFTVTNAHDFIKLHAFTDGLHDAYALGLSGDISSAYNFLVSMLRLVNWNFAYNDMDVEPSGTTQHTHEFMHKIMSSDRLIVMFVPVIVKKTDNDNPTLDEIRYLIAEAQKKSLKNKVILVFGAYEFFPLYFQCVDPVTNAISSPASFKGMLDYLVRFYSIPLENKDRHYRSLMQHMLETRIRINANEIGNDELRLALIGDVKNLLRRKISYVELLQKWLARFPSVIDIMPGTKNIKYIGRDWADFTAVLDCLNAVLFTGIPWFGSDFQLNDVSFVKTLKTSIEYIIFLHQNDFQEQVISPHDLNMRVEEISKFLLYLDDLIKTIEYGLQWRGISDFQSPANYGLGLPYRRSFQSLDSFFTPDISQSANAARQSGARSLPQTGMRS